LPAPIRQRLGRDDRPRWHLVYFALAGFDLLTVLLGLYLGHRVADIYAGSVAVNHEWADRLGRYDQLRRLASAVNAPGNNVFDSHDVAAEWETMQRAQHLFDEGITAARNDLAEHAAPDIAVPLVGDLETVGAAMDDMTAEARLIFSYFENNEPARAGERMATMDRKYDIVNTAFGQLNEHVRDIQASHFSDQMNAARNVQRFEWVIAVLILLMVVGATAYGHHLFKQAGTREREREREQRLQVMLQSEQRFRALVEYGSDIILMVDDARTIRYASPSVTRVLGYQADDLVGQSVSAFLHPDDVPGVIERCDQSLREPDTDSPIEFRFAHRDGSWRTLETVINAGLDPSGTASLILSARDITERRLAEDMIRSLAYFDPLTTLPNRALLQDRLTQAILTGHRENTPVAFILMDLDRFKDINNTLGHHHGDLLLRQIGPRIQKLLRESDTIARLGGDEFAILLPDTDGEGARQVVAKLEKTLEAPFAIDGLTVTVEASIGIALYPEHGSKAETLIQRADVAMYTAKQSGCGHAVYSPEHDHYSPGRLALMGELRYAIEHDELVLHYQPKIDLQTSRVIGVEALVRWQHPHRGLIPPDEFVPLAEQTGLIKPLTLGVITAALRQLQIWHRDGLRLNMAVNLSAKNLQDPQLPDQVAELLQNAGASPEHLELEITESTIMADPARALDILTRLNRMGLVLTIDDFGTGYSSLGYLKRLPVSAIKIDKSFVRNMAEDDNDAVIVRSTIELAHNLGLTVVAEGVETQYLLDRLAALGCDAVQGYYMSRAMPADALTRWFHESPWQVTKVVTDPGSMAA
jgi:diguanylate cyclase (GGDEF)-like protein/PAS domain S-box-containing protein